MKATNYFEQKNYLKAERLYKNLMIVLRNTVRDHLRLQRLLVIDFEAVDIHLVMDDINDTMSCTGTIHNLATTCQFLNKLDEAELFYRKSIDTHFQICSDRDTKFALCSMKSLALLYIEKPNKHNELAILNERIAAIEANEEKSE
jgi:hypothetical protein